MSCLRDLVCVEKWLFKLRENIESMGLLLIYEVRVLRFINDCDRDNLKRLLVSLLRIIMNLLDIL